MPLGISVGLRFEAIMFDMTRLGLQVQKLCSLVEDQFRDVKRHPAAQNRADSFEKVKLHDVSSEQDVVGVGHSWPQIACRTVDLLGKLQL